MNHYQCSICADYWINLGRPTGNYLIVSRGGHIPGVHDDEQLRPAPPRCEICAYYWVKEGRQLGNYLNVSKGGHIPGAHQQQRPVPPQRPAPPPVRMPGPNLKSASTPHDDEFTDEEGGHSSIQISSPDLDLEPGFILFEAAAGGGSHHSDSPYDDGPVAMAGHHSSIQIGLLFNCFKAAHPLRRRAAARGGRRHHPSIQSGSPDSPQVEDQLNKEERQLKLYQAAVKGDWKAAELIFGDCKEEIIYAELTVRKETVLHVAILAEKTKFVRKLVSTMNRDDLARMDIKKQALSLAALTGKTELAKVIIDKNSELENSELAKQRTIEGILPIQTAAFSGHRKMVEFLYRRIKHDFMTQEDLRDLLVGLIDSDMFDIALEILHKDIEDLLVGKDTYGETALSAIARKPQMLSKSGFFACLFPGSKHVEKKLRWLLRRIWEKMAIKNEAQIIEVVGDGWRTIFVAVENGNVEFLRILMECYPDVMTTLNEEGQSIFHVAVLHRQRQIFELIHTIGSMKMMIAAIIDIKGNHMLHLAAQLAPSHYLQSIPGEALQLQRELLWFKRVERVVGSRLAEERNIISTQTPREIFIENHKDMIRKGEDRIKKTADSYILVAILVATVVFAAAYTVAGGLDQSTGYPMFLHDLSFKIFTVAVSVSLISSVTSVLTFLSLLTSAYALEEFVWRIPTKLLWGFSTLFVSLISMLVAFVTVFFVYFKQDHVYLKYGVPVALASLFPPLLFVFLHGQLFNMMKSTLFAPN